MFHFIARDRVGIAQKVITPVHRILPLKCYLQAIERGKLSANCLWLELGARSVWIVNPRKRTVEVISPTVTKVFTRPTNSSTTLFPVFA